MNSTPTGLEQSIAFVDGGLGDLSTLLSGIESDSVFVLDSSRNGIEQISEILAGYENVESIHIYSHGEDGSLQLGSSTLDASTLSTYADDLSGWGQALNTNADVLFYGCNVAASNDGTLFLEQLSQTIGADIAASDDLTGQGGDWALEATVGEIETDIGLSSVIQSLYSENLAVARWTFDEPLVGNLTEDSSLEGGDNPGFLRNGTGTGDAGGSIGGTLVFDGVDDYVDVDSSVDINQGTYPQRTITAWFNVTDKDITSRKQVIYEEGGDYKGANIYIDSGRLYVGAWDGSKSTFAQGTYLSTDQFDSNTWHHVTLVLDAAPSDPVAQPGAFRAYIDGVEFAVGEGAELSRHNGQIALGAIQGDTQFHDGDAVGSGSAGFGGSLGEVAVYNEVLSAAEIADLANGDTPPPPDGDPTPPPPDGDPTPPPPDGGTVPGAVARWTFDEQSGAAIPDSSTAGGDNPGLLRNGATLGSAGGSIGGTVELDGINDFVDIEDSTDINLGNFAQRTISAWFNVDSTTGANKQVIFEEGGATRGLNIYVDNGSLYVGGWNEIESGWDGTFLSTGIQANTWYHVALVLDAAPDVTTTQAGAFRGYLNGVEFGSGEGTQIWRHAGDIGIGAVSNDTQFHDGDIRGTAVAALAGSIGEVAVYNEVLTAAEIASIANGDTPPPPDDDPIPPPPDDDPTPPPPDSGSTGPVGRWTFDEVNSTETPDSSTEGSANPGFLFNGASLTTAGGSLGGAVQLDGVDDYVEVNDSPDINLGNFPQRTITAWFNVDNTTVFRPNTTDTEPKQVIYEEGGGSRGLNIYIENDRLYVGGWNLPESNWTGTYLSTGDIQANTWHHVALVLDADPDNPTTQAGAFRGYLDGVEFGSGEGSQLWRHAADTGIGGVNQDSRFLEGGFIEGTAIEGFGGEIAEVAVYNSALSASDISALVADADIPDGGDPPPPPPPPTTGTFEREVIVSGLDAPQAIEWIPNSDTFYIAEKSGLIRVYENGSVLPTPFLDIRDQVNNDRFTTRGLTDLAVHPDFENNPYVYFFFAYDDDAPAPADPENPELFEQDGSGVRAARVIRVTADAATGYTTAVAGSEVVLLGENSTSDFYDPTLSAGVGSNNNGGVNPDGTYVQDYMAVESNFHNTGSLEFGPDGALYVSLGDGAIATFNQGAWRSQELDSLNGKILRIDPITGDAFDSTNPFYDGDPDSNRSKVWQWGLRNPFRITIHPVTGQIYIGETGWNTWEEVNTGPRGANFGWPYYEGGATGTPSQTDNLPTEQFEGTQRAQDFYSSAAADDVVAPLVSLDHANDGARSVVMGDIYLGTAYPDEYQGDVFFVDASTGIVRNISLDSAGNVTGLDVFATGSRTVSQIIMGDDGRLYYVDLDDGLVGRWNFA
ncbi:MAG: DUF4347 domain-containing protein [Synechococcus sp.]